MDKKKTLLNLGIVVLLSGFVLTWLLKEDFGATLNVLQSTRIEYLVLAIAIYGASMLVTTVILWNWLKVRYPTFKFSNMLRSNILAVFARNVSPMQAGGQPMHLYVLSGYDVKVEDSVFMLSIDFVVYQTAQVLFSLFWIILYLPKYASNNVLFWGVLIGFAISSSLLVLLYIMVASEKLHHIVSRFIIKVLTKVRIVKNPEEVVKKIDDKILEFSQQLQYIKSQKKLVLINLLWVLVGLFLTHSIPFILINALGINVGWSVFFEFIALSTFVSNYNALLPMPGGTGGLESVYMMMFGAFIASNVVLKGYMVLWRVVTYYIIVLGGSVYFIYYSSKKNMKKSIKETV